VFRDPYFLDFLGLQDHYLEKDLEDAILRDMETFLMELGIGFAFLGRQKHIQINGQDFYIDLLFYNRYLNRLIIIELLCGAPHNSSYVAKSVMCCRVIIIYISSTSLT
ncbi:MAG: PDDEXK nuclease domain-containing protein, partial [Candidatus Thorarchaeota archaeon]